jgi:DNA-binding FadR family transcriptional regulator
MVMAQIGQPAPRRAYADAANRILDRLRADRVAPGTRLPAERQLADELGVSRATVRESLAALELMGVLETHAGAGSFVRGALDLDQEASAGDTSPLETITARLVIEPQLARLAARTWDRRSLAAIARPLRALEREAAAGSDRHPTELDRQFHAAVAAASGNSVLLRVAAPLSEVMGETLWRRLKERSWSAEQTSVVAREHRRIYDAIRARDDDLAAFAMEAHLRHVLDELSG